MECHRVELQCRVCGDKASGKHYGVASCDGCRGFFKRSIRRARLNLEYVCKESGRCTVDVARRNQCQSCRFSKCIEVNMRREAVQHERAPRSCIKRQSQFLSSEPPHYHLHHHHQQQQLQQVHQPLLLPPSSPLTPISPLRPFPLLHPAMLTPTFPGIGSAFSPLRSVPHTFWHQLPFFGPLQLSRPPQQLAAYSAGPPAAPSEPRHRNVDEEEELVTSSQIDISSRQQQLSPNISGSTEGETRSDAGIYSINMMASFGRHSPALVSAGPTRTTQEPAGLTRTTQEPAGLARTNQEYAGLGRIHQESTGMPTLQETAAKLLFLAVRWTRTVPSFVQLRRDEQIALLEASWGELFAISAAQWPLIIDNPGEIAESSANTAEAALQLRHLSNIIQRFNELEVDHTECACLRALVLFKPDVKRIRDPKFIEVLQDQTHLMLHEYVSTQKPTAKARFGRLLLLISSFRQLSAAVLEEIFFQRSNSSVPIAQLLNDVVVAAAV